MDKKERGECQLRSPFWEKVKRSIIWPGNDHLEGKEQWAWGDGLKTINGKKPREGVAV